MLHLACFQQEIPQNIGTLLRNSMCLGFKLNLIYPLGFLMSDRFFKRASLDYGDADSINHHASWSDLLIFVEKRRMPGGRLIALDPLGSEKLYQFPFHAEDILLLGPEQAGLQDEQREAADHVLQIPLQSGKRSLNMAIAGSIAISEAQRQVNLRQCFSDNVFHKNSAKQV